MLVSRLQGPLTEFPPDVHSNLYKTIIEFAVDHCPEVLRMLVDILVKKDEPVQEKDVLKISFIFSSLAHGISRHNNCVPKVKSLLFHSQGLTAHGQDKAALLGVTESSRSTLNITDLLAEVSDAMLHESSKTMCSQSTIDNLDFQSNHMCLEYKQLERQDTSHLNTESMESSKVAELFNLEQVLIDDESHKAELKQVTKVAVNSVGRLLAKRLSRLKVLKEHLPLHHEHQNSEVPNEPANIMIMKLEGLQETVNSEMVEYLDILQRRFLHEEVAAGMDDISGYREDLKLIEDKEVSIKEREDAENRVKQEVLRHGSWVGHGDLLTVKMFYTAKSLRSA